MTEFVQLILIGVSQGCIYGLIALGFVMIYKATEMVNFAQGDLMMIGSFVAWSFVVGLGMNFWAGLLAAVLTMAVFGYVVDASVVRRIIGQPQFSAVILTIGLGIILRAVAGIVWGNEPLTMPTPFSGNSELMNAVIGNERLAIIIATVLLIIVLWAFFRYSRWGIAVQASSQNQMAAYYLGIPVRVVYSAVWAGAASISTLAGVLLAPITLIEPLNGLLGIKAFAAAVIGGFGSMPGAIFGGIAIGLAEAFAGAYAPETKETIGFVLMLVVLTIRPQGLFERTYRKKV
jgi:branched-chain amino acid transport system permease protein